MSFVALAMPWRELLPQRGACDAAPHGEPVPRGPVIRMADGRLAVADLAGGASALLGLPASPRLEPLPSLHPGLLPASVQASPCGQHLLARIEQETAVPGPRMSCFALRTDAGWRRLPPSPPTLANGPAGEQVLGGWVGDQVLVVTVHAGLGKRVRPRLCLSRYDRHGALLSDQLLLDAAGKGRSGWPTPPAFWWRALAVDQVVVHAWDQLWRLDTECAAALAWPPGLPTPLPAEPSRLSGDTVWLCAPSGDEYFAWEWHLASGLIRRLPLAPLLRQTSNQFASDDEERAARVPLWPLTFAAQALPLDADWLLLNLHDGSPLNRTACWLYHRPSGAAWAVSMQAFPGGEGLVFDVLADIDRVLASQHDRLFVSQPVMAFCESLLASPEKARALPAWETLA